MSEAAIDLSGYKVTHADNGTVAQLSGILQPQQRVMVANATSGTYNSFLATSCPQGTTVNQVILQTGLKMKDDGGTLQLQYSRTVVDGITYEGSGARNGFVSDVSSPNREPVYALVRDSYVSNSGSTGGAMHKEIGGVVVSMTATQNVGSIVKNKRVKGRKCYELKNHLGNVLVVVSDLKKGDGAQTAGPAEYYQGIVLSAQDYYAFGSLMPGRNFSSPEYRYGFNGQEKDDEWSVSGGMLSFEFRVHDARLGRFLSVDPISSEYPWNSTYAFAENRVIDGIDLEGGEYIPYGKARLKFAAGGLIIQIKNCWGWTRDAYYKSSKEGWKNGQMGADLTIAMIDLNKVINKGVVLGEALDLEVGLDDLPEEYLPKSATAPFSMSKAPKVNIPAIGEAPPSASAKQLERFSGRMAIIDFANFGVSELRNWVSRWDMDALQHHAKYIPQVLDDITIAIATGYIPPKYQNVEDIQVIANVILYGEPSYENRELYDIGMKIFNDYSAPKITITPDIESETMKDATDITAKRDHTSVKSEVREIPRTE